MTESTQLDLAAMALQVCSLEELQRLSRPTRLGFLHLLEQKALRKGAALTRMEILGIKEIALDYVSPDVFNRQAPKEGG